MHQLFTYNHAEITRDYLLKELGLGVNLPAFSVEEEPWGRPTFRFALLVGCYNRDGRHAVEGVAVNGCVGKFDILSADILYVWERKEKTQDIVDFIVYNVDWVYELYKKKGWFK